MENGMEMDENEFNFQMPASLSYLEDILKNSTIVEEGPMLCPVCSSVVVQYYVDFSTKFTMCPNAYCEYPFGENYTVYSSDGEQYYETYGLDYLRIPKKKKKTKSKKSEGESLTGTSSGMSSGTSIGTSLGTSLGMSAGMSMGTSIGTSIGTSAGMSTLGTNSNLSASEWLELNRASQSYDSDDSSVTAKLFAKKSNQLLMKTRVKKREDEQHIKQNVEMIKECNKMLFEGQEEFGTIRNEKWIKNLSAMQSSSGKRLVKEHELKKLKSAQDNIQHGELKIDIASKEDAMSSIVIKIGNVSLDNKQCKKT